MDESNRQPVRGRPAHIIGLAIISTICVVAAAASLVYAIEIFLVLFLAVLFGVFLSRISGWLSGNTSLSHGWSLGIVTTTLVTMFIGGILLFGVQVDDQIAKARTRVDEAETLINDLAFRHPSVRSILSSTPFLHDVLEDQPSSALDMSVPDEFLSGSTSDQANNSPVTAEQPRDETQSADSEEAMASVEQDALKASTRKAASVISGVFKTTFGLLVNSALIFFVGLFIAIAPGNYRDGIVSLFPPDRRQRTTEVLNLMGDSMWHWLIGRFGSMLITGVGAGLLLAILGVPMAASIGIVTALLTFIPNIGGLIALLLAILFALPQGGMTVGLVVGGYALLQLVESYVATPLIQQKQVAIPPGLLIAFQAVMGVLFGFLGAAVASPLLAAAKVGVEEAYIKDVLERKSTTGKAVPDSGSREDFNDDGENENSLSTAEQEQTLMA